VTANIHTLTGAYAVDALSADEQAEFERHLEDCDACRQEVRELRETGARLAVGVAQEPPAALREHVLAEIAGVRQLPPVVTGADTPVPLVRSRRWSRTMLGVAAALVAAVLGLSVVVVQLRAQLDETRQQAQTLAAVVNAPDATSVGSAQGRLVVSRSAGKAVYFAGDLPPKPDDKAYQLWFMSPEATRSAAVLAERPDRTEPVLLTLTPDADQFGITIEPAGGSPSPTSPPVAMLDLPAA
jgi:anti-sigma-K factor RskA